ncbi:MAG: TetR/AcrR family transcriptional regulator [Salinibacterium sp.]|nr:TetR/AcrR family transcriptional regulator [Salinibacterium sp.]
MATHSVETWLAAATQRFNDTGLSGIRVEAIARDIGATKGSFYWHFASRQSLVDAVIESWERRETENILALASEAGPAEERLAALFSLVTSRARGRHGELTLYADAEREGVLAAVERVTKRRVEYVADILGELGFSRADAVDRATISVAVAVGIPHLAAGGWRGSGANLPTTLLRMTVADR